ncbi:PcfB family protein [Ruminococcus sp.]|uniref:PcfB family protein n=1 Tax=Ruminococcus sp. TaxID=41978 RepID=UPI001B7395EF|nr:PcfB family protein [Ruminococcus sp.]MBP5432271.1 PcfB family protein [Ruminococcus sp.]
MQEYNNEKIVALSFKSTKVTTNVLVKVLKKLLELQKKHNSVIIHGKQPLKALIRGNDNASVTNIEINDQNIKAFEKTARKYGIDYSLKKDSSEEPPRYTIFFRAKDSEIMTTAFKDFLNSHSANKENNKKTSIITRLKELTPQKNKERTREKTRTREAER